MKAIIIGGGPVACLTALGFRKRNFEVHIHEKGPDPRLPRNGRGHSFNLTLTLRGLNSLERGLRERLYAHGVPLPQRVIHHVDGSLSYQPYGTSPEHHLLSIPRGVLHQMLLSEAERAGARVFFGRECIRADPGTARATFASGGTIVEDHADVLIGCDGANSVVRHEMSRHGARLNISQEFIPHGYLELKMPAAQGNEYSLLQALRTRGIPESAQHGLHVWPRGDFMLLSQPNVDKTYTTTLFMPLIAEALSQPSFRQLDTPEAVQKLFQTYFPDVMRHLPRLTEDFFAAPPASLKTIKCYPYHFGRAVLIGDAAHTMVPFYGQGINCSFEDVRAFFELFDRSMRGGELEGAIRKTLGDFTSQRKAPGDAIAKLSLENLRELSSRTGDNKFHARGRLERQLHLRYPGAFTPLYSMVAFSNIPYDEVLRRHEQTRQLLDDLCHRFDVNTEAEQIMDAYGTHLSWAQERSAA